MNRQIVPGCICSEYDESVGRYSCSVSGDQCMFMIPDAIACARRFGEGPLSSVISSDEELYIEQLQEDVLDLTTENAHLREKLRLLRPVELAGSDVGKTVFLARAEAEVELTPPPQSKGE